MRCIGLLIFFLFTFFGFSQEVTVYNQLTGEPIPGVAVFNRAESVIQVTDFNGKALLDEFSEYEEVVFRHLSFKTVCLLKWKISGAIYMVPYAQDLEEVVVSASKFEQNKREVAQRIRLIKPEAIFSNAPQTSADLLQNLGPVFIQKSQLGGGSPMIRGFSTHRLLLSVDGIRMNNAIFRSGNLQNVISIDPLSLQSSEVILGPGSVIYGSDAIGGVMNFYTKRPQLRFHTAKWRRTDAI